MNEDLETDPATYSEWTTFHHAGMYSVMTESLIQIMWNHHIDNIGTLYICMSNFPEPFHELSTYLNFDFDDLKQELTNRLSGKFLRQSQNSRSEYQLLFNPQMQKFSRYVEYCDLLAVPGVIAIREYECFRKGKSIAVYVSMSKSDATTALLLPKVHQKTGLPVRLMHEH